LCDREGLELGRGLVNYSNSEIEQIKGQHSTAIDYILGYVSADTVVHRNNLVMKE
ncbi:MAG: PUA domain-containing protein, partial [Cyanobacteria bacterium J06631_2]